MRKKKDGFRKCSNPPNNTINYALIMIKRRNNAFLDWEKNVIETVNTRLAWCS